MLPYLPTRRWDALSQFFFFFNDTATTEIYTLSLHDALPILSTSDPDAMHHVNCDHPWSLADRKSTRLNSSHGSISYAVFCLKKTRVTTPSLTGRRPARPAHAAAPATTTH